jgi:hypothetical protein
MRELSELELRSVSGGATAPVRRPVLEAIKRLLVRIIDSILPGRPTRPETA